MAKVIIFGAGEGASVAYRYFTKDSKHEICAFTVEQQFKREETLHNLPIVDSETVTSIYPPSEYKMFVALGNQNMNKVRYEKYRHCKDLGYEFVSYVSSTILFSDEFQVGENCLILENNTINFDVRIGNNVTIWSANHIGNRTVIEDNCWISSHACLSAGVHVKEFSFIGINASISNDVVVGEENFIGANALITKDTSAKQVYLVERTTAAQLPSDKFFAMFGGSF